MPIQHGRIIVNGKPVTGPGPDRGIVFQHFALYPVEDRSRERALRPREAAPAEEGVSRGSPTHFIELVGLRGFEESYPSQLSGGMKQRVAIARTLAIDPDTLLMDEPFGALDAQTRALMQEELIAIWNQSPKTVVFVTHDVREAVLLADRVAVMSARPGRLKEIVDTRFPGGLNADVTETPEFLERVKYTWNLVREEAIAAERQTMTLASLGAVALRAPAACSQLAWEAVTQAHLVSQYALPTLSGVLGSIVVSADGRMTLPITPRSRSCGAPPASRAAIVFGTAAGVLMAWYRPVRLLVKPFIQLFYPLPKSALIPLTIMWIGLGDPLEDHADLHRLAVADRGERRSTRLAESITCWCGRRAASARTSARCCGRSSFRRHFPKS